VTPLMVAAGLTQVQGPRANRGEVSQFSTNWGPEDSAEAVEFLIAHGADVNATNPSGQTALHGAAYMGADAVVRLLARHGAKLNVQDAQGQTPYRLAEGHLNVAGQGVTEWPKTAATLREVGATQPSASTAASCCGSTSGPTGDLTSEFTAARVRRARLAYPSMPRRARFTACLRPCR
jgi:hypothetical protein